LLGGRDHERNRARAFAVWHDRGTMIDLCRMIAFAALSLLPGIAWADDIATDEDVCQGRDAGEACRFDGGQGFCRKTTCTRLDYSSGKPKSAERECMRCMPEAKVEQKAETTDDPKVEAKTDPKPDAPVEAKTDAPVEAKTDAPFEAKPDAPPAKAEPTKATVSEQKTAPASAEPAAKSCAVDPVPASLGSMLLGLALVFAARRRTT
jgi:MYXO-CTERM domain-containing protein